MKTLVALSLLATCWAACKGPPAAPPSQAVTIALESAPNDLDPRFSTDANSSRITGLVFAGLVRSDGLGAVTPDLAASWEREGEKTYVFHLRPQARFHDGSRVLAADVRATYLSVLDPRLGSPKREELAPLEDIEIVDDSTVRFHLRKPFSPFLAAATLGVLPQRLASKPHVTGAALIGAGPFRLSGVSQGESYRLEPFDGYWGGAPRLRTVIFRVVPDAVVRGLELAKGTITLVQNALEPEALPWLRRRAHLETIVSPGTSFHYLGLNLRHPILSNLKVRRAIALAIDRDAIVTHLLSGQAAVATGLLTPGHWAYEPKVATYERDTVRARRLLDEAGYLDPDGEGPKPRFSLTFKTSTVELRRRIAEALQFQLRDVGIDLKIRSLEWATFYSDVRRGNFELFSLAWVGIDDPDIYHSILHSDMEPPYGNNRGGYVNPLVDALTERGRTTGDIEERRRIYSRLQKIAARDLPFIPLWWEKNVIVKDRRLKGFRPRPDGDLIGLKDAFLDPPPTRLAR